MMNILCVKCKVGLEHVLAQFKRSLAENGVEEIETKDKRFDHALMEAVETRETTDEKQDDMVAEELKGGYRLHTKVIIPARVAVYKINQ
jgi:molecular chaperone GrpE (heat shock protein)